MKYIINLLLITTITSFLLVGCGSGSDKATFDTGEEKVDIQLCPTYEVIELGDLLVKDTAGTQVQIILDSNATKKICVVSGSAHIIREN